MAAFFLIVLLAIFALAVDLGYLMVVRTELQRAADAAALAAAESLASSSNVGNPSSPAALNQEARQAAQFYASQNIAGGKVLALNPNDMNALTQDLVLGYLDNPLGTFDPNGSNYNAAVVTVRRDSIANGKVSLFFAKVFGVSDGSVTAQAAAYRIMNVKGFRGPGTGSRKSKLLPFALHQASWQESQNSGTDEYRHDRGNKTVSAAPDTIREMSLFPQGIGAGNFGTVDLGNTNNSTADLRRQILNGPNQADFDLLPNSAVELDATGSLTLEGDTGMSSAMKDDLLAIVGEPRIVPVYDTAGGTGNNSQFNIVGFAGITVVGVKMTGPLRHRYVKIQPSFVVDKTSISGGNGTSQYIRGPVQLVPVPSY